MKRALTVILSVMMLAFGAVAFAACGDGNDEDADKVTLQALTGEADVPSAFCRGRKAAIRRRTACSANRL